MQLRGNKAIGLRNVKMKDDYFLNAYEKEVCYLTSFDVDRLLAGFRETARVDMRGVSRYPGWESMLIGGHTLGHYITACVRACESANCSRSDRYELLSILKRLGDGLMECQEAGKTGFLFGAVITDRENVELQFDYVEQNKTNIITQAWVPWYTMHKTLEGLVAGATLDVEEEPATEIRETMKRLADRLGDWVYKRVSGWDEATHRTVLGIEYGGMNDCMYDVYLLTGKKEHLEAAHGFDQTDLFERVAAAKVGDHILNNHHANTTIPKFLGALKRYRVTKDAAYLDYATKFWQLVTEHHSYITGGNSEWEHFGEDRVLDKERTNCNCETCNVYNMLKMTKALFEITGDVKYADWYENTFLNSILPSQHPDTGMTTYFQPMASGYYKVYGEPFTKFWCCTGTGMENFAKLQESFYFAKDDKLIINQYIASSVVFGTATVVQSTQFPKEDTSRFEICDAFRGQLWFRLPYWLAGEADIFVDGKAYEYKKCDGYGVVEGYFEAGTVVTVRLPRKVTAHSLPDGANTYAFRYGPVVLSALLGKKDMNNITTGVDVTIPEKRIIEAGYIPSESETILIKEGTVEEYMDRAEEYLLQSGEELSFELTGTDATLRYVPHYSQHEERYGIYFRFEEQNGFAEGRGEKERNRIDTVQPGYGQYENDAFHQMTEHGTGSVGITEGGTSRYAKAGGSFVYTMEVKPEGTSLLVTFQNADEGKGICIFAGEEVLYEKVLQKEGNEEFYQVEIPIPQNLLDQSGKRFYDCRERRVLTIGVRGIDGAESASVCGFLYTVETK